MIQKGFIGKLGGYYKDQGDFNDLKMICYVTAMLNSPLRYHGNTV